MKVRTKNALRDLAKHVGLKLRFVNYLDDNTYGKLLPGERRILLNIHKPRIEHMFTILHELGHYVLHVINPHRRHHPGIFDIHWKIPALARLSSLVRRYFRFRFNKSSGKEWEANLWALCAFVVLTKRIGCWSDLRAFLSRHPEMTGKFILVCASTVYTDTKEHLKRYACFCSPYIRAFLH